MCHRIAIAFLLLAHASWSTTWAAPVQVAVSVPPQAFLVEQLAGEHARTEVMVPASRSPETYTLTPRQIAALEKARLYVAVGHPAFGFERNHLGRLREQNQALEVVEMVTGVELLPAAERHGNPFVAGSDAATDAHVWLSPKVMADTARRVTTALQELDPDHADFFALRLVRFLAAIDQLDREIRANLGGVGHRRFLVVHPAWGYFAADYGLEQVAIEHHGKEPGAAHLRTVIDDARKQGTKVIFVQKGFSERSATVIALEIDGEVVTVDPLARDWFANLRRVAAAFGRALGASPN